jgi:hypothetical protein
MMTVFKNKNSQFSTNKNLAELVKRGSLDVGLNNAVYREPEALAF